MIDCYVRAEEDGIYALVDDGENLQKFDVTDGCVGAIADFFAIPKNESMKRVLTVACSNEREMQITLQWKDEVES